MRLSLTAHLTLGVILLWSKRLPCTLKWPSVTIAGARVTLYMLIMLKILSVRNVVVLTELGTTDCWLGHSSSTNHYHG